MEDQIVAISGDADMYHVECAGKVYGEDVIELITANGDQDDIVEIAMSDSWPRDNEGNDLCLVWSGTNGLYLETGQPHACGYCLAYLVADERASDSPLARDILNLASWYKNDNVTRYLSHLASIARKHDYNPQAVLHYFSDNQHNYSQSSAEYAAGDEALTLAADWQRTYYAREIIHLTRGEDGTLTDADGTKWIEYDMRGYLDMLDDGESACESCRRRVESHAFYPVWDSGTYYCPDCVEVV